jgi:hypothetical protein
VLPLLLLLACADEVSIEKSVTGCTDYDFSNPAPSELVLAWEGAVATIQRTNALLDSGNLGFDPVITAEDGIVTVVEAWTAEAPDGNPFCYVPGITVSGASDGTQVRWYLDAEDNVPFRTLVLEAP